MLDRRSHHKGFESLFLCPRSCSRFKSFCIPNRSPILSLILNVAFLFPNRIFIAGPNSSPSFVTLSVFSSCVNVFAELFDKAAIAKVDNAPTNLHKNLNVSLTDVISIPAST